MSRVKLSDIPAITFYKGSLTAARRTDPIPQLICRGSACKLYQPEVVRCKNLGGSGTDVDWKCEADLPEALRFGRVEVGCEGWSKPGDTHVLKGSCSLEYRLVEVPRSLRDTDSPIFRSYDVSTIIFMVIWIAFLAVIAYSFVMSCLRQPRTSESASGTGPRPGGGSGWFPGGTPDDPTGPPPPYSKPGDTADPTNAGWRPGFWTGAALGGVANHLWNRSRNQAPQQPPTWDWERDRVPRPEPRPLFGGSRGHSSSSYDRGEGSSNLGSMRRSTGFGGSNVR